MFPLSDAAPGHDCRSGCERTRGALTTSPRGPVRLNGQAVPFLGNVEPRSSNQRYLLPGTSPIFASRCLTSRIIRRHFGFAELRHSCFALTYRGDIRCIIRRKLFIINYILYIRGRLELTAARLGAFRSAMGVYWDVRMTLHRNSSLGHAELAYRFDSWSYSLCSSSVFSVNRRAAG